MADKKQEVQFPTEVIDLPSGGTVYSKDSPLSSGKLEIKYMTAREEDILTSANLIKKGVVIDRLLDSLIITEGVKSDDMILGDKNAVMVAARILAYGPEYECQVTNPNTGNSVNISFNLATSKSFTPLVNKSYSLTISPLKYKVASLASIFWVLTDLANNWITGSLLHIIGSKK